MLAPTPAQARLRAELSGRVFGYDQGSRQLNITTRLGSQVLLVTNNTAVFVNGRSSTITAVQVDDRVDVAYDYATSRALDIEVTRERRRSGTIAAATANSVDLRISGNRQLTLQFDSLSRADAGGLEVTDRRSLAGLPATVVYQPGTNNLVLSLDAQANTFKGAVTAIDTNTRVVTVRSTGRDARTRTFTLDSAATLRRDGVTAQITSFVVGDRVTLAFARQGATLRGIVLQGRPGTVTPTATDSD